MFLWKESYIANISSVGYVYTLHYITFMHYAYALWLWFEMFVAAVVIGNLDAQKQLTLWDISGVWCNRPKNIFSLQFM